MPDVESIDLLKANKTKMKRGAAPVGKSGAMMCCMSSAMVMSGLSIRAWRPATTSLRL